MKRISRAFSYIFSDNEWFNKVLVGGFYFLLIPFGVGIVMLNGFFLTFIGRLKSNERTMPYWRNVKILFASGLSSGIISLTLLIAATITMIVLDEHFSIVKAALLFSGFLTVNSLIVVRRFNILACILTFPLLLIAILFGWMWIVVGWPLLIFLATLVQIFLLADSH